MGEGENSFQEMIETGRVSEELERALMDVEDGLKFLNPKEELERINIIVALCLAYPETYKGVIEFLEDTANTIKETGEEQGIVSIDSVMMGVETATENFFLYLKFKIFDDSFRVRLREYDGLEELERLVDQELNMLDRKIDGLEEKAKIGELFIDGRKRPRRDALSRAAEKSYVELKKNGSRNPSASDVIVNIPIEGNIHEIDEYGAIWWKNSRGIEKKTEFKSFQNRLVKIRKKYNNIHSQSIDICH